MAYCQSCGVELEEGVKFCTSCGEPVKTETTTAPVEDTAEGEVEPADHGESQSVAGDLEPNVAAALSYLLGFVTGLIFFLVEEDDEFVRFHAAQSMVVFGGLFVLYIILNFVSGFFTTMAFGTVGFTFGFVALIFSLIWLVLALGGLGLWIYLMVTAYQGDRTEIPIAAGIAEDLV